MADTILFYALGALLVISALLVVTVKNIFHAALFLALALFVVAAFYVTLGAYFLAALQVLIYIGAVVVLAIFVINLTRNVTSPRYPVAFGRAPVTLTRRWVIPAAIVSALTACLIIIALLKAAGPGAAPPQSTADPTAVLGRQLLGSFVLPFELASVLLLSALIAAIAIVGKDREEEP
jgi:NADH-quinone oxidoreductase subunit J